MRTHEPSQHLLHARCPPAPASAVVPRHPYHQRPMLTGCLVGQLVTRHEGGLLMGVHLAMLTASPWTLLLPQAARQQQAPSLHCPLQLRLARQHLQTTLSLVDEHHHYQSEGITRARARRSQQSVCKQRLAASPKSGQFSTCFRHTHSTSVLC